MSCYLVNQDTLELLAAFACQMNPEPHDSGIRVYLNAGDDEPLLGELKVEHSPYGSSVDVRLTDTAAVVRELYAANVASVRARYGDADDLIYDLPANYRPRAIDRDQVSLAEIAGAIKCYQYQACEVEGWLHSFAYRLTEALARRVLSIVSQDCWEWERPADFATRVVMEWTA